MHCKQKIGEDLIDNGAAAPDKSTVDAELVLPHIVVIERLVVEGRPLWGVAPDKVWQTLLLPSDSVDLDHFVGAESVIARKLVDFVDNCMLRLRQIVLSVVDGEDGEVVWTTSPEDELERQLSLCRVWVVEQRNL